jgi:alkylation response protein AidB-like acyl-CoA dehydrogenase
MVGPTIMAHGTDAQKEFFLTRMLRGDDIWCQLFSEPGAGSDLASLSTKATRVEGGWLLNGQKVWTSMAKEAEWGICLARTDADAAKHDGISCFMVDMHTPGIDVRPLRELTGHAMFNEVFFDDVFVPDRDVVGAVNAGWTVAMATLGNERVSIGGGSVTMTADALLELLARHRPDDGGLVRDVGALLIEAYAAATLNLRQAARAVFDTGPGIEGNIAKLFGAEHAQRVAELALRIAGPALMLGDEGNVLHDYLFSRCLTIAGGTSEVVRNLIAERILGLPREPAPK